MSRKRAPNEAGINMHAKKEDLEYEEQIAAEERRQKLEENDERQISTQKVKKVARRSLGLQPQPFAATTSSPNELSAPPQPANPFSAVQFMASPAPTKAAEASSAPATGGPPATTTTTSMGSKDAGYYKNVAALNQHFMSWFQEKMKQDSAAPLTAGVGKYIEYCLQFENGGSIESAISANSLFSPTPAAKPAAAEAPKSLFGGSAATETPKSLFGDSAASSTEAPKSLFGGNTTTTEAPKSLFAATPATGGGLFATAPAAGTTASLFASAPAANTGGLFGSSTANTGGLFGSSTAPAAGSLFGPTPTSFGDAGFSSTLFTSPPPQSATATPEAGDEEGGDDNAPLEEDEPVVEVIKSSNDTDDVLFEADSAKVSMLVDKEFKPKGEGRIAFLRNKADQSKCQLVIRSPTTGKIFFNASVSQSMKQSIKIKSRSVLMMTMSFSLNVETNALEPENDGKPGYYRMVLKTEDEAKRLHDALIAALN